MRAPWRRARTCMQLRARAVDRRLDVDARVRSRSSSIAISIYRCLLGNTYPSEAALADQHALAALGALAAVQRA